MRFTQDFDRAAVSRVETFVDGLYSHDDHAYTDTPRGVMDKNITAIGTAIHDLKSDLEQAMWLSTLMKMHATKNLNKLKSAFPSMTQIYLVNGAAIWDYAVKEGIDAIFKLQNIIEPIAEKVNDLYADDENLVPVKMLHILYWVKTAWEDFMQTFPWAGIHEWAFQSPYTGEVIECLRNAVNHWYHAVYHGDVDIDLLLAIAELGDF